MNKHVEEAIESIKAFSLNENITDAEFRKYVINSIATMEERLAAIDEDNEDDDDDEDGEVDEELSKEEAQRLSKVFNTLQRPSPELANVIGATPRTRTKQVKALWDYIKIKGLQDKKDKRMLNADEKLMPIFKQGQVSMFNLAKILNEHLTPID